MFPGIRDRGAEVRDDRWPAQLDPVQQASTDLRGPQDFAVGTQTNAVCKGHVLQDRRDGLQIRRHVVDPAHRTVRVAPEVREIEAAVGIEDEIIRQEACAGRNDRGHARAVGIEREDASGVLEVAETGNEYPAILMYANAGGPERVRREQGA